MASVTQNHPPINPALAFAGEENAVRSQVEAAMAANRPTPSHDPGLRPISQDDLWHNTDLQLIDGGEA